jgi:hypothetical protein
VLGSGEVAASLWHIKRGDLGQLAPRKKLLKSISSFPENFLRPSEHSLAGGIFISPPAASISSSFGYTMLGCMVG